MKKVHLFVAGVCLAFILSSCAAVQSPVLGSLYTDVHSPVAVTSNTNASKVGKAKAQGILGLVATGDASIQAAAKEANITKIHHVDQHSTSILGLFCTYEVLVYGE